MVEEEVQKLGEVSLKSKFCLYILFLFFVLMSHAVRGETKTKSLVKLIEHTYDDQLATIYPGNSVDYRSSIVVRFIDSLITEPTRRKMKIGVIREKGGGFELPPPGYFYMADSGTIAYNAQSSDAVLKETYIQLQKWAVKPGGQNTPTGLR